MAGAGIVHVVDDDAPFRRAIARLLRASGYEVALYESANHLLEAPDSREPGCILLDVQMPGLSGPQLQARLAETGNLLPIVFLTGHGDVPTSVRAIKKGAEDFLLKPISKHALIEAVTRALARYEQMCARVKQLESMRALVVTLTPREREVFALIVRGKLNKQVAFSLGTSQRTIKAHRSAVMQKLKVRSFAEAVTIAERLGMLAAADSGQSNG
jgi:FixJ family two-component response regulator